MSLAELKPVIERAFENRAEITPDTKGETRDAVEAALAALDAGQMRVAEKLKDEWVVHQWLKMAVLLSFRLNDMSTIAGGPGDNTNWWDKVPSKFEGWGEKEFRAGGFRAVPGAIVRRSAHIAKDAVLMPSFVHLGASVAEST